MKLAWTVAIVMAVAAQDHSFKGPTKDEKDIIQAVMSSANDLDAGIKELDRALTRARHLKKDPAEIRSIERLLSQKNDEQSALRTKAIHMVLNAYKLWPQDRSGVSVMPLTKGREISWIPVARERESRQIQDANGGLHRTPQGKPGYAGRAYPDGVSYILPEAFMQGPGYLASTLLHERTHFQQMITPGNETISEAKADAGAFKEQAKANSVFFDQASELEKAIGSAIESERDNNQAIADREDQEESNRGAAEKLWRKLKGTRPPDFFESRIHALQDLEDLKRHGEQFEVIVAREMQEIRRKREGMEAARKEQERVRRDATQVPLARPDRGAGHNPRNVPLARPDSGRSRDSRNVPLARPYDPEDVAQAQAYARGWASRVCSNPDGVTAEEMRELRSVYSKLPVSFASELGGCPEEILREVLRIFNSDLAWSLSLVRDLARESANRHRPPSYPDSGSSGGSDRGSSGRGNSGGGRNAPDCRRLRSCTNPW